MVLALLSSLMFAPLLPFLALGAVVESEWRRRGVQVLRTRGWDWQDRDVSGKRLVAALAVAILVATGALWVYSHLSPQTWGVCHKVVTRFGARPTEEECEAYGPLDFAVPLVIAAGLLVILGDFSLSTPWGGLARKEQAAASARQLAAADPTIQQRAQSEGVTPHR
jgi:hypothetical protein